MISNQIRDGARGRTGATGASVEDLRLSVARLQKRVTGLRILAAAGLMMLGLAAMKDFHILVFGAISLTLSVVVLVVGIPTQLRLRRARGELAALLR